MKILVLGSGLSKDDKIEKISKYHGHILFHAKTGREALKLAGDNQIDVVFLESSVSDIDSRQFIAAMKNRNPQCKIVVVLEPNFERLDVMGKNGRTDYYLIKPLEGTYVENIIQLISSDIEPNNSRI